VRARDLVSLQSEGQIRKDISETSGLGVSLSWYESSGFSLESSNAYLRPFQAAESIGQTAIASY
jgi:hypothetical protein